MICRIPRIGLGVLAAMIATGAAVSADSIRSIAVAKFQGDATMLSPYGAVSENGTVVRWNDQDAVLKQPDGSWLDLGNLGSFNGQQGHSEPFAVNDSGTVVGEARATLRTNHAWVSYAGLSSDPGRHSVDLGSLAGPINPSLATAVNNSGTIVGQANTATSGSHAFIASFYGPYGGQMVDMGTLGGKDSYASAINDLGQVVGASKIHDAQSQFVQYTTLATGTNEAVHAFVENTATPGAKMTDLGTLPGFQTSFATAINNKGQIVGTVSDAGLDLDYVRHQTGSLPGNTHAFLYDHGTMMDLNDLLPKDSGWLLQSALSINDAGQITGLGQYNGGLESYELTLSTDSIQPTPVPEPTTLALFGLIAAGAAARRRARS